MSNLLVRGGRVHTPGGSELRDILVLGGRIVAVEPTIASVDIAGVLVPQLHATGMDVFAGLVDQHCHPTGGGGGQGPASQNLPLMFEEFTTGGITSLVGVLGHDTVVRNPESLLSRVRALQAQGLHASMLTGEISAPPVTLTGDVRRDIALVAEVRGLKMAIGELGAVSSSRQLADLAAAVAAGSRTAGKPGVVHIHIGADPACLDLVEQAVNEHHVPPGLLTITHVNWNAEVLGRSIELGRLGVNLDVTACITPAYFAGTVAPEAALKVLVTAVPLGQLTASSDSGGSHPDAHGLVVHTPGLLVDVALGCLSDGLLTGPEVAAIFAANPAGRNGLSDAGRVEPGAHGDLLVVNAAQGRSSATVVLGGRVVVADGTATVTDPLTRTTADR